MCFTLESYRLFAHLQQFCFWLGPSPLCVANIQESWKITICWHHDTHNSSRQVKNFFRSLTPGEIALRAQRKTLEKIERNIAGKPAQLKTSEARMVKWIKEYNRSSWRDVWGLGLIFLSWYVFPENVADLYKRSYSVDHNFGSRHGWCIYPYGRYQAFIWKVVQNTQSESSHLNL